MNLKLLIIFTCLKLSVKVGNDQETMKAGNDTETGKVGGYEAIRHKSNPATGTINTIKENFAMIN